MVLQAPGRREQRFRKRPSGVCAFHNVRMVKRKRPELGAAERPTH